MIHEVLACMQCEDHPCYEQCPKKDEAMRLDENGIVYIVDEYCNGCGRCKKYCKFTPSRINLVKSKDKEKRKAKKCDLCRTRAEGPACIQWCPVCCIGLSNNPQPTLELMGMPPGPPIELRESPMRPAEPLLELESPPSELIGVPGIITRASQTNNDVA
jgi:Fe-S-cluster-containing dehydrogenase component